MELFKDNNNNTDTNKKQEDYYVRIKYNERVLQLPDCQAIENHHPQAGPSFCRLSELLKLFKTVTPTRFMEECRGFQDEISDR